MRKLETSVTVFLQVAARHALVTELALLGSPGALSSMGLQFSQGDHLVAHVTDAFHVRASLKMSGLITEFPAPQAALGVVGATDLQPSNLHLDRVVRERSFAYVYSTHGAFALGRGDNGPDTVGAEPERERARERKERRVGRTA